MKRILAFVLAFSMMLTACGSESSGYKAGTYTSTVDGHNAPITVEVTFTDSAIETVVVKEHSETPGLSDPALERVPADIVKYQSLAVDTVAGATVEASVVANGRGKKVIVYKYKRKTGYHKKNGHRQAFTKVKIEKING